MIGVVNKWFSVAGLAAGLMLASSPAQAVFNLVLTEAGGNVVANGSGSINMAGLKSMGGGGQSTVTVGISGSSAAIGTGYVNYYQGLSGPANFGSGEYTAANNSSGDILVFYKDALFIKQGYVSQAPLANTATWNAQTLASLGLTQGTYTWTFGSGANADSIVLYVGTTPPGSPTAPPSPPPVPSLNLPSVQGLASQLTAVNMAAGSGPSMTTCLLSTVTPLLGANAAYLGQNANGAAQIAAGGQTISFEPLRSSVTTGSGLYLSADNASAVGTSCGAFSVVPAIANLGDFAKALAAMGLNGQIDAHGVITANVHGTLYAVRPDYVVTQGTATGTPSIAMGADGVLRFTDSAGKVQILRAAVFDPQALSFDMGHIDATSFVIQIDGSGMFTQFSGQKLRVVPDMFLTPAPGGLSAPVWVNGPTNSNHYQYLTGTNYQGLTITPF